ncbi:tetratricopeptide repeat protein [uncultured Ramlibacter sp.]|uniref:tetratricopeptide repeat protein n=1 Tax=uncultured Ramlibacter sp. TaxID=260755 RepID=UPI002607BC16|nr:tetratricopeptide repeat protein [uncultured Ramlibacter sp.]
MGPAQSLAPGAALLEGGRFHEALAFFREALQREPGSVAARLAMAQACAGTGDALTAAAWLGDACRLAPHDPQPWQLLGELQLGRQLYLQALPAYAHLYGALGQRDRATLLHYGFCLEHAGALHECVQRYREAVALEPEFFEAHVDLAGVLWRIGDFEGALAHARQAEALQPAHPYAVRITGTALLNLNRLDEAEAQLRRALNLKPGFDLAELDLAFTLLLAGKLAEGWRWYATRWKDTQRLQRPAFFNPAFEWRGPREQPLAGRRVAVYAEQGLGDVLQFLRYVPLLQQQGATVSCVVQPELAPLIEHSLAGVQCLGPQQRLEVDSHVALLELPLHLGTTMDSIPAAVPYLRARADTVAQWRERLAPWNGKCKVGIAWSGFQGQVNNHNRAIALSAWLPLLQMEGVQCFSLQKADAGPYSDIALPAGQLPDFTGDWQDFNDSAAMLEALDLVITVDTAIAHLAGALGRPTWLLLAPNADWRWLLEREDSPWYPTLRLFRRGFGEDRAQQMARAVQALRQLAQPAD